MIKETEGQKRQGRSRAICFDSIKKLLDAAVKNKDGTENFILKYD